MKKVLLLVLAALFAFHARAEDAAQVFSKTLAQFDSLFFSSENCEANLSKPWGHFSGSAGEYAQIEQKYIDGGSKATICAIRRGYLVYVFLGEVEKAKRNGALKRGGPTLAIQEATASFEKIPLVKFNDFLASVRCSTSTPRITFSGSFNQELRISCETNLGPAKVDLDSMYVTVGGRDFWNGRIGSYYGRSLDKALDPAI